MDFTARIPIYVPCLGETFVKKLLISVAGVLVLLFAVLLIVPSFIDWNARKQEITAAVREATGRDLTILGNIDVTILPNPAIRVADVRFANVEGAAAPDMIRVQEARVSIALGPLFEGRLAAVIGLVKPIVHLEKLKNGDASWNFKAAGTVGSEDPAENGASGSSFDFKLDRFEVIDGTVTYYDAGEGSVRRLDNLNSTISFESLSGPFKADGVALIGDMPLTLQLSTGRLRPKAPLPLSVMLTGPDENTVLRLQGSVTAPIGDGAFVGEMRLDSENFATFLRSLNVTAVPAAVSRPFAAKTEFTASKQGIGFNTMELSLGDVRATGTVTLDHGEKPRLTANLRSTNFNLDTLLSEKGRLGGKAAARPGHSASGPKAKSTDELDGASEQPGFSLPDGFEAAVQLAADVMQYRGGIIRRVAMRARLKDGRISIDETGAIFPGNTWVEAKGEVTAAQGLAQMDLRMSGQSDNLREALGWLDIDVTAVPADRLRRFKFTGSVAGTPRDLIAKEIDITLDSSQITGGMVLAMRERPAFGLRIEVDRFNFDGYSPSRRAGIRQPRPSTEKQDAAATRLRPPGPEGGLVQILRRLNTFDANIDATVKRLVVAKTTAEDFKIDVKIADGTVELRKASVSDYAGLRGAVSGKLAGKSRKPEFSMEYNVTLRDRARFVRFLDRPAILRDGRLDGLSISGKVGGTLDRLKVETKLTGMDGQIDLNGSIRSLLIDPTAILAVAIRFPELANVVQMAARDYTPAAGKLGAVDVSFQAEGTPTYIKLSDISGSTGPVSLRGNADIELSGARPKVRLSLSTSEVLLDLFRQPERKRRSMAPARHRIIPAAAIGADGAAATKSWSRTPLDLSVLHAVDADITLAMAALTTGLYRLKNPQMQAQIESGKLSIDKFVAAFSTGTFSASGSLEAGADEAAFSLRATAKEVDIADLIHALRDYKLRIGPIRLGARMQGPVSASMTLSSSGASEHDLVAGLRGVAKIVGQPQTTFTGDAKRAGAISGLAGAVLGNRRNGLGKVGDLTRATGLLVAAFEGASTLNGDIDIQNGVISTRNLVLVGRGGRALTAGTAHLRNWKLNSATDVTLGQDKEPFIIAQMTGPLDDPYVRKISGSLISGGAPATKSRPQPARKSAPDPRGSEAQPDRQPEPPAQPRPPGKLNPEDVLRQLLEGAGR
jgi:uncharacterized protein involved in outer membrane biogenesis